MQPEENIELYKHYLFAENPLLDLDEYIIRLIEPRVYIRFDPADGMFTDYDEFYANIAEVQWLDGAAPPKGQKEKILTEAWNFLALCERKWEDQDNEINPFDEF